MKELEFVEHPMERELAQILSELEQMSSQLAGLADVETAHQLALRRLGLIARLVRLTIQGAHFVIAGRVILNHNAGLRSFLNKAYPPCGLIPAQMYEAVGTLYFHSVNFVDPDSAKILWRYAISAGFEVPSRTMLALSEKLEQKVCLAVVGADLRGDVPYWKDLFRGISALEVGQVEPLFQPHKKLHSNTPYDLQECRIKAVCLAMFLHGKGTSITKAVDEVAEKLGLEPETLKKWKKRLSKNKNNAQLFEYAIIAGQVSGDVFRSGADCVLEGDVPNVDLNGIDLDRLLSIHSDLSNASVMLWKAKYKELSGGM